MSGLLTTGEMIDRLKFGEVAETLNKDMKAYWITDVERNTKVLQFSVSHENYPNKVSEYIQIEDQERRWRILPNYVSFNEAMRALKQGKMVKLHGDNNLDVTVFRKWYKLESREDVTFDDLFNGKWTIEED